MVELRLCALCCLARRIEAPKETADERRATYTGRAVSLPRLEEERSVLHFHFDI